MSTTTPSEDRFDDWRSLRQIDTAQGWSKGTAFRAFKALAAELQEGRDYRLLDIAEAPDTFAAWREAGALYPSSVKLILLSPAVAARLAAS